MAKFRRIPGTLNNLASSYFSTLKYYQRGYMADWIWKIGIKNKIWELKIDILKNKCTPIGFNVKQIKHFLPSIRDILVSDCQIDGVSKEYISECWFDIKLRKQNNNPIVFCIPFLKGQDDRLYKGNELVERPYELDKL